LNDELQQTRRISGFSSALSQFIRLSGTLYVAEQQKKLDMSRSAKAPRRRDQKNHMFKVE
jgi:hypothetical protein